MDLNESTQQYYKDNAVSFSESTKSVDMSELYDRFLPYLASGTFILDAGCGSGRDAKHFQSLGHKIAAFDASLELAQLASKYLQIDVPVKTFQTFDAVNSFDGIWCCASLLHVPKAELEDAIARLRRALKVDGVLYMSFKYGDQERVKDGRFFCDQNEETITEYIDGFKVLDTWVTGDQREGRSNERWLNLIIKKLA
ncbi:SAM-dependent methyltransferase [Candidatus Poribacteria bacterium]|nr:SAM-dependent methyltransferase [Candidatus Poribacteria bacterium]